MNRVTITGVESAVHGLPPVRISFDAGSAPLLAFLFRLEGTYLHLSGPPGGPLGVVVQLMTDPGTPLEQVARALYDAPHARPFVPGVPTTIELAGARRPALPFVVGTGHARSAHVLTVVDFPVHGFALRVDAWAGGATPDAAAVLANPHLAAVLRTLTFEYDPPPAPDDRADRPTADALHARVDRMTPAQATAFKRAVVEQAIACVLPALPDPDAHHARAGVDAARRWLADPTPARAEEAVMLVVADGIDGGTRNHEYEAFYWDPACAAGAADPREAARLSRMAADNTARYAASENPLRRAAGEAEIRVPFPAGAEAALAWQIAAADAVLAGREVPTFGVSDIAGR